MIPVALSVVGGVALLAFAPDRFVAGSAGIADRRHLSKVIIGAVVIGFGTGSPELLASGLAAAQGQPDVGIGGIVGSNLANLGLIVAVAALVGRLGVPAGLLRRELPLMVAATAAFAAAAPGGITRLEGTALLAGLVAAVALIVRQGRTVAAAEDAELVEEVAQFLEPERTRPMWHLAAETALGLAGTLAGAQLLVSGAVEVADRAGLSGGFVGMTVVALGTSLPELVTALAAVRAGEDQLILGNVLGSNLFNSLAVGGVIGWAGSGEGPGAAFGPLTLMLLLTALAATVMTRRRSVSRAEASLLLGSYVAILPLLAL